MGEHGVFPWETNIALADRVVSDEVVVTYVEEDHDPIVRYDVGDAVDPWHYPDGSYWRFGVAGVYAKRFVVRAARVASVTSVVQGSDGAFAWATRTDPPLEPRSPRRDLLAGLRRSLALSRPPGWVRRLFLGFVRWTVPNAASAADSLIALCAMTVALFLDRGLGWDSAGGWWVLDEGVETLVVVTLLAARWPPLARAARRAARAWSRAGTRA